MSESIDNLLMKYPISKITRLFEQSKINNDNHFSQSSILLSEVKKVLKVDSVNTIKLIYYNRKVINDILYDKELVISLDDKEKIEDLSFYFYLCLLIIEKRMNQIYLFINFENFV